MIQGKNKIGFIGLGQAGGNICEIAEHSSYKTIVFNTSPEDLESLELVKIKKIIGDKGGCGKDRNEAKEEIKNYYSTIVEDVKERFMDDDISIVYIVFSSGGGTGSGMGPILLDILNKLIPDITFAPIVVLPSLDESIVAQINTLECLREIYKLNLPTFLVDNESYSKGYDRKTKYDRINNRIIRKINLIFDENRKPSKYGNIDQKDLFKLLTTPGVISISETIFETPVYEAKGFSKLIMDSIDNSILTKLEFDNVIIRSGYILEIEDSISKDIELSSIDSELGVPLEVFEGYYKKDNDYNTIISILSGLSFPESRLSQVEEVIRKSKDSVNTDRKSDILSNSKGEDEWFNKLRDNSQVDSSSNSGLFDIEKIEKENDDKSFNIDDIFDNY